MEPQVKEVTIRINIKKNIEFTLEDKGDGSLVLYMREKGTVSKYVAAVISHEGKFLISELNLKDFGFTCNMSLH